MIPEAAGLKSTLARVNSLNADGTPRMIPEAAVEAAVAAYLKEYNFNAEEIVQLVLEAAAPHMLAEAWDDGYTTGNAHNGRRDANPYRSATHGND